MGSLQSTLHPDRHLPLPKASPTRYFILILPSRRLRPRSVLSQILFCSLTDFILSALTQILFVLPFRRFYLFCPRANFIRAVSCRFPFYFCDRFVFEQTLTRFYSHTNFSIFVLSRAKVFFFRFALTQTLSCPRADFLFVLSSHRLSFRSVLKHILFCPHTNFLSVPSPCIPFSAFTQTFFSFCPRAEFFFFHSTLV